MKIRTDFVTNSSSTAYIIYNKTEQTKTLVDFVKENLHLIKNFREEYGSSEGSDDLFIKSAQLNNIEIKPGKNKCIFGDESGTLVGSVLDYMLRDGGHSESFSWSFDENLR